eukprot:2942995-Amphidinium_carterae.1
MPNFTKQAKAVAPPMRVLGDGMDQRKQYHEETRAKMSEDVHCCGWLDWPGASGLHFAVGKPIPEVRNCGMNINNNKYCIWTVHFRSEHYSSVRTISWHSLCASLCAVTGVANVDGYDRGALQNINPLPSTGRVDQASHAAVPHNADSCSRTNMSRGTDRAGLKPSSVCSNVSSFKDVALGSWNVGSWRLRSSDVLAGLRHPNTPTILCLQEIGLTSDGQRSASSHAKSLGFGMIHGAPCAVVKSKQRFWRTCRSTGAGVATIYPASIQVAVAECRTSSLAIYVTSGRVQLLILSTGPLEPP